MNYKPLIDSIDGWGKDWEIVSIPLRHVSLIPAIASDRKLITYMQAIRRGVIFPPICVDKNNNLKDGAHRSKAHFELGDLEIVVIREVGDGTGRVIKDEFYADRKGEFVKPYLGVNLENAHCLNCERSLQWMPAGLSETGYPEFPMGMPAGPYFYCRPCGLIINPNKFIVYES